MDIKKPSFPYEAYVAELQSLLGCDHASVEPRRKLKARSRQPYYRLQCVKCGKAMSPHLPYSEVQAFQTRGNAVRDWDEKLNQQYRRDRSLHAAPLRKRFNAERLQIGKKQYARYLQSDEWRALREAVFARNNYTCKVCNLRRARQVHHLTYERIGHELDSDLIAVCETCHKALHEE